MILANNTSVGAIQGPIIVVKETYDKIVALKIAKMMPIRTVKNFIIMI